MLLEMGAQEAIYVDRAVISGVGCGRGRLLQCLAPRLRCTQPHGWPGPGSLRQRGNGESPAVTSKEETLPLFDRKWEIWGSRLAEVSAMGLTHFPFWDTGVRHQ